MRERKRKIEKTIRVDNDNTHREGRWKQKEGIENNRIIMKEDKDTIEGVKRERESEREREREKRKDKDNHTKHKR